MANQAPALSPDFPITIKVAINETNRRFKLPLRDLGVSVFSVKVAKILHVPDDKSLVLERYSDSSSGYITLDVKYPATYKQLYRAAKAKQKLRFRASLVDRASKKEDVLAPVIQPFVSEPAPQTPCRSLISETEVPKAGQAVGGEGALQRRAMELVASLPKQAPPAIGRSYQVCCNNCDRVTPDAHFHCSICDKGDFDLCEACVNSGVVCKGEGHWLLKRLIRNGSVVNSTTEKLPPKSKSKSTPPTVDLDSKPAAPQRTSSPRTDIVMRTCNACVRILPESGMITCTDCDDYDICMSCHVDNKHGHHPGHTFKTVGPASSISAYASALCAPGRNTRHNAICDACDKTIYGIRHKCLDCSDFDYCNGCVEAGRKTHDHRFVKVFDLLKSPQPSVVRHFGVYCDGPLCDSKARSRAYIQGVRYKCAVCDDFDLCANCEGHPSNTHNKTHPLIKFKTMVMGASITTFAADHMSGEQTLLGDGAPLAQQTNAEQPPRYTRAMQALPLHNQAPTKQVDVGTSTSSPVSAVTGAHLNAHFTYDHVVDGAQLEANTIFTQTWVMRNPGPHAWPIGCSVRLTGGDNMLNIDESRVVSANELALARKTNENPQEVAPGECGQFSVAMKAPNRAGRHISYWRLKAPDGTAFGHKLWCDIEVKIERHYESIQPIDKSSKVVKPLSSPPLSQSQIALADRQMQLMLLESQCIKKRFLSPRQEPEQHVAEEVVNPQNFSEGVTVKGKTSKNTNGDSVMVFPKLDKESPMSSAHEDYIPAEEESPCTGSAETETTSSSIEPEQDIESVQFSDSDADDGFYTDEEYDILDASDEEILGTGAGAA